MSRRFAWILLASILGSCAPTSVPLSPTFQARESARTAHQCQKTKAFDVAGVPVWHVSKGGPILFVSKMDISADGAPNAYHPKDRGTDRLASGGTPGNWWAIATEDGSLGARPILQGRNDPFPGYYISMTALFDKRYERSDPRRFVDARSVPYFVMPQNHAAGARLGDIGMVYYPQSGRMSPAIYADVGSPDEIGEGSIRLARNLGIDADPRSGGVDEGVVYLVFPRSGQERPMTPRDIRRMSNALFEEWGGQARLKACLEHAN